MPPGIEGAPGFQRTRRFIRKHISPIVTRVNGAIGSRDFDRASLINHLRNEGSSLPLSQQAQVIRVLESESVIKARFQGQANSFSELGQFMVASSLTAGRANQSLFEVNDLCGLSFAPVAGETRKATGQLGDLFFDAKQSLAHRKYSPLRAQESAAVLHRLSIKVAGSLAESDMIAEAEARLTHHVRFERVVDELKRRGIPQKRDLSDKEISFHQKTEALVNEIEANSIPYEKALETIAELANDLNRLRIPKDPELKRFLISTRELLEAMSDPATGREEINDLTHDNLMNLYRLMNRRDGIQLPLIAFCLLTATYSILYMLVRVAQTSEPGYIFTSYLSSVFLLLAEMFCLYLGLHANLGTAYALVATRGAHGQSWLGKVRTPFQEESRRRRAPVVTFLSAFNEPVGVGLGSMGFAVRATMEYGNANVQILDDSFNAYNLNGVRGAVRMGRQMAATVDIVRQLAESGGIPEERAYMAACDVAALATELEDPEMGRFAVLRAAEDVGIRHRVVQRKAKKLSRIVLHRFQQGGTINQAFVRQRAVEMGIEVTRAEEIGREVEHEIACLVRRSEIAERGRELLETGTISPRGEAELIVLLREEHGLTPPEASALIARLKRPGMSSDISQLAAAVTGEYDVYSIPERRRAYYAVHHWMEGEMYTTETKADIDSEMGEKFRQIVEWRLFASLPRFTGTQRQRRQLLNSTHSYQLCDQIGREIRNEICAMRKLDVVIEEEIQARGGIVTRREFLGIEEEVWEQREQEVGDAVRRVLLSHRLTDREDIREVREGILANLQENREERRASAMALTVETCRDLGGGKADAFDKYLKGFYGDKSPLSVIPLLTAPPIPGVEEHAVKVFAENTVSHSLRTGKDKLRGEGYVGEKSGKAGEISMCIHGFTRRIQLGSMLRQILLKEELEAGGEINIPEEITSKLDPKLTDRIPETETAPLAHAENLARYIASQLNQGVAPEAIVNHLVTDLRVPSGERLLAAVTQEILARITLHRGIQAIGNGIGIGVVDAGLSPVNRLRVEQLLQETRKRLARGELSLAQVTQGGPWILRMNRDKQLSEPLVRGEVRGFYTMIHELQIIPEGRTHAEIAEWMIAVRRLPERTSLPNNFGTGDFARELRTSAELLDSSGI